MTKLEFSNLQPGDIVQHVNADAAIGGHTWMVAANYGNRITLVETVDAQNPSEWEIVHV